MWLYFFLIITIFWILKPLKKTLFVKGYYGEHTLDMFGMSMGGPEAEQIAKVANMLVAFVAATVFTFLSRSLERQRLAYVFIGFCMVCLAGFIPVLGDNTAVGAWSFYLFGDLFNTIMLAAFFAFLNDSVSPSTAKRLYGPIVLGGVAGGMFGSLWVASQIEALSLDQWMYICIGLTAVIATCAFVAGRIVDSWRSDGSAKAVPTTPPAPDENAPSKGTAALEGARLVFRSRYLLAIVTIVALYEIVSTILDYQFTATIAHYAGDNFGEHISTVYFITNSFALGFQLFLTGFVMRHFGVRVALLIMPLAIMTNSAAFVALPILWIGSALNTTDNGLNYSVNQSARESLYTPTTREEKYRAKAFIDMFVQRFAKALAVVLNLGLAAYFGGFEAVRWLSIVALALAAVWIVAANYAGRRFQELERHD